MAVGATAASRQLQSKASELSWIRTGGATAHSPSGSLVWLVRLTSAAYRGSLEMVMWLACGRRWRGRVRATCAVPACV